MKIVNSRYAQIGLALIIAVLLIAGVSGSAAAAGQGYHTVPPQDKPSTALLHITVRACGRLPVRTVCTDPELCVRRTSSRNSVRLGWRRVQV